ncbi:MAG: TIGR02206 family membrane protein, partial [Peptostreptococcaceae bacterium]
LIFNKHNLMKIGGYWGILGSVLALLMPSPDPFLFPHITLVSFFIGHLLLLWGSIYVLVIKKIGMNKLDLKNILLFTNVYCVAMYIINYIVGSNYGYMSASPIAIGSQLNTWVYALIVIMISNIVISIEYIVLNKMIKLKGLLVLESNI